MSDKRCEVWKPIEGYEGLYEVSDNGNVRNSKGVVLKQSTNGHYFLVCLFKDGRKQTKAVHRMVAETFIPNPCNKPQVNHIDENRYNNQVENLEWCSSSYNTNYGTRNKKIGDALRTKITKQRVLYEYNGNTKTLKQWADSYGMSYQLFYSRWRKGKRGNQLFEGFVKEEMND